MTTLVGTILVTSDDGSVREFEVKSPGDMITLAHQLLRGTLHVADNHEAFIAECVEFSEDHVRDVGGLDLIQAFSDWCISNKIVCPLGRNRLYQLLESRPGVVRTNPHNKTCFRGLKLLVSDRVKDNNVDSDLI